MATEIESKTHADYTVGWICALSKEQTAATAMLDKRHGDLPNPHHDNNTYTLGSIGNHNVVIACLPDGRYGTCSAANVVTLLAGTFPSVKFCLMVGIGGGIPSNNVRLGDVVVGRPEGQFPGVVQWDIGKAKQGGEFERMGALDNPPKAILTALAKLRTDNELNGSKISLFLDDFRNKYPRAATRYLRSDSLVDVCFKANYDHVTPVKPENDGYKEEDDETDPCRCCDKSKVVKRKDRGLQVHYGLIASGNQVIRNSILRDKLNQDLGGNVLCIEMEAAGIINNFPCLVIRGICDYSDSHKNKDWQEHAAAIAAAYAKEVLIFVQPTELKGAEHTESQREDIDNWLSPLKPLAQHVENRKKRVEGTGTWFLQDSKFLDWCSGKAKSRILPCYGDPGAGKTIIASLVIDHLGLLNSESRVGLGFIYCDYRDQKEQTIENILGVLLIQLLKHLPEIPAAVSEIYKKRDSQGARLGLEDASELLRIICALYCKVYICLDALDELQPKYLEGLLRRLCDVSSVIQIFLTGRSHVQSIIQKFSKTNTSIVIKAHEIDIRRFVEHEIGGPNDLEPGAMDAILKNLIMDKVLNSAKGIFLLPIMQIQAVLQATTMRDREEALQKLPSNLGEAFDKSMIRIQQQPVALAERAAKIIAWVHLVERPLKMNEILCWLAIRDGDNHFNPRGIPIRETLLHCCHGLVVMDRGPSTVRLVHYSLQEYLIQQNKIFDTSKEQWHTRIACACLTFLKFPSFHTFPSFQKPPSLQFFPPTGGNDKTTGALLAYAATQWGHHFRRGGQRPGAAFELGKEYLAGRWPNFSKSLDPIYREMGIGVGGYVTDNLISLPAHIAAFFGLEKMILHLRETGLDLDRKDGKDYTPLSWAASNGYEAVVKILLDSGVALNWEDRFNPSPLASAARNGHAAVVKILIDNGAAVNLGSARKSKIRVRAPLLFAAECGDEEITKILVKSGAIVDLVDLHGRTALSIAARNGHEAVVRKLIENGATVDLGAAKWSRDRNSGQTPLSGAAQFGHNAVVKTLIENGATVNLMDDYGHTALFWASKHGHETIVKMLISHGAMADPTYQRFHQTALSAAAQNGHEAIVKMLIAKGIAVDSIDRYGRTPLLCAAKDGHTAVVKTLVENGASLDLSDEYGQTPLSYAIYNRDNASIKIMIEYGAAVTSLRENFCIVTTLRGINTRVEILARVAR